MVTSIDSALVVSRFFEHSSDCLSGLREKHTSLASSFSSLQESYKNPDKVTRLKHRLLGSEKEAQEQEKILLAIKGLLDSSISIIEHLLRLNALIENSIVGRGKEDWLTPEIEQEVCAYLHSLRFLFNTKVQEGLGEQKQPTPEGLLETHASLYPDGLLQKAERLRIELHVQSSFISEHLAEFHKALVGLAGTITTIWGLSIQAGLLVVSGPFVGAGVPLLICISLTLIGAGAQVAKMRHAVKMGVKPALDKEVLIHFIENLKAMESLMKAIFRTDVNVQKITQDTQQIVAAAERTEKNTQVGAEALNKVVESQARIEQKVNNQQPAIVINNNLSEGAMRLLLEANARGELSSNNPLLLAFTGQTSATLQITGAPPSGANESEYLSLRKRKISATSTLSAISEESLSASSSRSSTPTTGDSGPVTPTFPQESEFLSDSSSSYKGKATTPLMVEIESEEEYLAIQEFRKQRQIEMNANLKAA